LATARTSLLLLPFIWITGDAWWVPALLNVACYALSAFVIHDLCRRIANERCGILAVALFTIWPSGLLLTGIAATEGPSLLLLLLVGWAMVVARDEPRLRWPVIAGFAIGIGALVRPSLLPLPALLLWLAVIRSADRARSFRNAVLASVVAIACITPWTLRNYLVLGTPVLISTNSGDVLYRANNPLAYGGFTPKGETSLEHLMPNEVAWDRASKQAAMEWILDNPAAFAKLAARKIAISFAEDTTGAYWALARAHNVTGLPYRIAVVVSNAWWVGVWVLILAALVRHREWFLSDANAGLLMWLLVLLPAVHAVFEAQPRYHMPIVGILVCISSLVAVRAGSLRST
jgi:4-amino-4-deoxy-L-arabinose transferase-like glycosyltransferase